MPVRHTAKARRREAAREQPSGQERQRHHQRCIGCRRGEGQRRGVGPDLRRQGLRADRRQQQGRGQLGHHGDEDQAAAAPRPGPASGSNTRRKARTSRGRRPPRLLQPALHLHQRGPHADQGQRQEHDGIGRHQQRRALIERVQERDGQRDQRQRHHDARHALRQIGGAFQQRDQPPLVARRQETKRQRQRHGRPRRRPGRGCGATVASTSSRHGDLDGRDRRRAVLRQPVSDHPQRHAERDDDKARRPASTGNRHPAQRQRCTGRRVPRPMRAYCAPPRTRSSANRQSRHSGKQNDGQQRGARPVEPGAVMRVSSVVKVRKRSRVKAPNSTSTFSATSSMPPSNAGRSCGSTTRRKQRQTPLPQRARDFLQRRIHAAQGRGDRQIDQRIVRTGHHQPGADEILQRGTEGDPGVAADERRNGQRYRHQHRPGLRPGKVARVRQPGAGGAKDRR